MYEDWFCHFPPGSFRLIRQTQDRVGATVKKHAGIVLLRINPG